MGLIGNSSHEQYVSDCALRVIYCIFSVHNINGAKMAEKLYHRTLSALWHYGVEILTSLLQ